MEPIQQGPLQRRRWRLGTARRTEEDVSWEPLPFVVVGVMLVALVGYAIFTDRHPDSPSINIGSEPAKQLPTPDTAPPVSPPPIPR